MDMEFYIMETLQKSFTYVYEKTDAIQTLTIIGIAITAIIGIIILLNQRKIRKELSQLREMMEATSYENQKATEKTDEVP